MSRLALTFCLSLAASSLALPGFAQDDVDITTGPDSASLDAFAADERMAQAARQRFIDGDYAGAIPVLETLAQTGNPVAMNILGAAFSEPAGPLAEFYDPAAALRWYEASAQQGYPRALHNMGVFYEEEHPGIAPDEVLAYENYRAAADLGYEESYYDVAWALANGVGVAEDFEAARRFAVQALGTTFRPSALSLLGDMAYYGQGEPQDYARSLELFLQSSAAGHGYGSASAAYQYYFGEGVEVDDARALELFQLGAEQGEPFAHGYLAEIFALGYGTEIDAVQAAAHALEGDRLGDGFSSAWLGQFYREGNGLAQDFDLARAAFGRAEARGQAWGAYQLGDMAYFGEGEAQDFARAIEKFQAALALDPDQGESLYSVAFMKMRGEGTEVDLAGAVALLERAIAVGNGNAQMEEVMLFGSPLYGGDHTDQVRARARCLWAEAQGAAVEEFLSDEITATCAELDGLLTDAEQAAAAKLAARL